MKIFYFAFVFVYCIVGCESTNAIPSAARVQWHLGSDGSLLGKSLGRPGCPVGREISKICDLFAGRIEGTIERWLRVENE